LFSWVAEIAVRRGFLDGRLFDEAAPWRPLVQTNSEQTNSMHNALLAILPYLSISMWSSPLFEIAARLEATRLDTGLAEVLPPDLGADLLPVDRKQLVATCHMRRTPSRFRRMYSVTASPTATAIAIHPTGWQQER
jgi:hypothetical protein